MAAQAAAAATSRADVLTWEGVKSQFDLAPDRVHMSGFYLASHPKPVRDAIDVFRRALAANPVEYHLDNEDKLEALRLRAEHTGCTVWKIALYRSLAEVSSRSSTPW